LRKKEFQGWNVTGDVEIANMSFFRSMNALCHKPVLKLEYSLPTEQRAPPANIIPSSPASTLSRDFETSLIYSPINCLCSALGFPGVVKSCPSTPPSRLTMVYLVGQFRHQYRNGQSRHTTKAVQDLNFQIACGEEHA
jgi:hypothetical protein